MAIKWRQTLSMLPYNLLLHPWSDEGGQLRAFFVQGDLPVAVPRVQRREIPHAWWDAGDDLAWHSSGIGGTLHVFVEAGEIHCDPWFCGGLLRDHHHRVAPCEGLADRDLLDHPFGDHGGELGFDGRAPLERNSARPIVAARDCVIPEVNVHRRPGHRTERCVFEDCRELRHDGGLSSGWSPPSQALRQWRVVSG